jgi:hypothetical protein
VLVAVAVAFAVRKTTTSGSSPTTTNELARLYPPADDVRVTRCDYTNYAAVAVLLIRNHSVKEQNYVVQVQFWDGKRPFSSAIALSDHQRAHDTRRMRASGLSTLDPPRHLICQIARIERFG